MEVVATAPDPLVARELIKRHNPDVLTLDVEMPRMDGLDFLEKLMRLRPMPVVMVSSLTERGGEITLRALELGAIDFVTSPSWASATACSNTPRSSPTRSAPPRAPSCARRRRTRPRPRRPRAAPPALQLGKTGDRGGVHGRHRSDPRGAPAPAAGQPGDPDHAAHAGRLHAVLRPAPGRAVRGDGARSRAWRTGPARPRLSPRAATRTCGLAAAAPTTSSNWTPANPSTATARRWTCCSIRPRWRRARTPSASS